MEEEETWYIYYTFSRPEIVPRIAFLVNVLFGYEFINQDIFYTMIFYMMSEKYKFSFGIKRVNMKRYF